MFKERKFIRHPTAIPIEVRQIDLSPANYQLLCNIGVGGLAFESDTFLEKGTIIGIRIMVSPTFEMLGKVAWCRPHDTHFDVGVEFMGKNEGSKEKEQMVDEVCQVEMYKNILAGIAGDIAIQLASTWE